MDPKPAASLAELVPQEKLLRIRDLFQEFTRVPLVITDADGLALTPIEDPLRFCGSLVHGKDHGLCLRRKRWDQPEHEIERQQRRQHDERSFVSHRCRGRFRDVAVAIEVEDTIVGYAVFARTLSESPDLQRFRRLAEAGCMSPSLGEAIAKAALVMPEEQIARVAEFLGVVGEMIATAAYDGLKARRILELEELRDSLMHMIVHDLRTPLTSVMGSLDTIVQADYEPDLVREFVPMSLESCQSLLEMVNTLLDINKLESGQLELQREPVDFRGVAGEALDQVRGLARERGHDLVADLADCPPLSADRDLLRRLVVNLLGNAIKFTPDGGHIELRSRCDGQALTFAVADNGPGIPEEDRPRIFEKFGQVRTRQAGRKYSTGLGLTFCKMVAEAHGGDIRVDSEVGKGSEFSVRLPYPAAQAGG